MRTWSYGINGHPDWKNGHVDLEERPWWLAIAEWFGFWVAWRWLRKIKLPNWPKIEWDGAAEAYSPREWWGNLETVTLICLTNPIVQWVWAHPRNKRTTIELGYDRVREIFYVDDPQFFDDEDERTSEKGGAE